MTWLHIFSVILYGIIFTISTVYWIWLSCKQRVPEHLRCAYMSLAGTEIICICLLGTAVSYQLLRTGTQPEDDVVCTSLSLLLQYTIGVSVTARVALSGLQILEEGKCWGERCMYVLRRCLKVFPWIYSAMVTVPYILVLMYSTEERQGVVCGYPPLGRLLPLTETLLAAAPLLISLILASLYSCIIARRWLTVKDRDVIPSRFGPGIMISNLVAIIGIVIYINAQLLYTEEGRICLSIVGSICWFLSPIVCDAISNTARYSCCCGDADDDVAMTTGGVPTVDRGVLHRGSLPLKPRSLSLVPGTSLAASDYSLASVLSSPALMEQVMNELRDPKRVDEIRRGSAASDKLKQAKPVPTSSHVPSPISAHASVQAEVHTIRDHSVNQQMHDNISAPIQVEQHCPITSHVISEDEVDTRDDASDRLSRLRSDSFLKDDVFSSGPSPNDSLEGSSYYSDCCSVQTELDDISDTSGITDQSMSDFDQETSVRKDSPSCVTSSVTSSTNLSVTKRKKIPRRPHRYSYPSISTVNSLEASKNGPRGRFDSFSSGGSTTDDATSPKQKTGRKIEVRSRGQVRKRGQVRRLRSVPNLPNVVLTEEEIARQMRHLSAPSPESWTPETEIASSPKEKKEFRVTSAAHFLPGRRRSRIFSDSALETTTSALHGNPLHFCENGGATVRRKQFSDRKTSSCVRSKQSIVKCFVKDVNNHIELVDEWGIVGTETDSD